MKRVQIERWSGQLLRTRPTRASCCQQQQCLASSGVRLFSSPATKPYSPGPVEQEFVDEDGNENERPALSPNSSRNPLNFASPLPSDALASAKLAALHARLQLPKNLPLQTMARTLVDPSADSNLNFNNSTLAQLGGPMISYHVSEWLLVTYPRLPMSVLFAAAYAYNGPKTLQLIAREWGVETAAAPGSEVDPGFLQFARLAPGTNYTSKKAEGGSTRNDKDYYRRGISSRVVYDDEFGDLIPKEQEAGAPLPTEVAYTAFVKAVVGSIYLHAGREAVKQFIKEHVLSRHLDISSLFQFKDPVRELSRLCAREGFEHPVARILSETGRLSRHPVFVVAIFSGTDKLGEGSGPSLQEARTRAAVASLKSWYLYSPGKGVRVPSDMEAEGAMAWEPVHIDMGEVIH